MSASVVPAAAVVIALPARVTRADVASLWREHGPRAATAARIELLGVREIDSAGVALVLELAAAAGAEVANAPARYAALAAAHRVEGSRP